MLKVAHRGFANKNYPENSKSSILKAIDLNFNFVEIDIRETKDEKIVLCHDESLIRVCGIDLKVNNHTFNELSKFCFIESNEKILLFQECIEICSKNEIGIIAEIKDLNYSPSYFNNISTLIKEYRMENKILIYPPREDIIACFQGKFKLGILNSQIVNMTSLHGNEILEKDYFIIGMPETWNLELSKICKSKGLMSLTTIRKNYLEEMYPNKDHFESAEKLIMEMNNLGISAINIDSDYYDLLKDY